MLPLGDNTSSPPWTAAEAIGLTPAQQQGVFDQSLTAAGYTVLVTKVAEWAVGRCVAMWGSRLETFVRHELDKRRFALLDRTLSEIGRADIRSKPFGLFVRLQLRLSATLTDRTIVETLEEEFPVETCKTCGRGADVGLYYKCPPVPPLRGVPLHGAGYNLSDLSEEEDLPETGRGEPSKIRKPSKGRSCPDFDLLTPGFSSTRVGSSATRQGRPWHLPGSAFRTFR